MRKVLGSLFGEFEVTLFEVSEQITTFQKLHDDVDLLMILENIQKADNVWMLTHFEDFYFTLLKFNVLNTHLFLGHNLYCNFFASLFMHS